MVLLQPPGHVDAEPKVAGMLRVIIQIGKPGEDGMMGLVVFSDGQEVRLCVWTINQPLLQGTGATPLQLWACYCVLYA